MKPKTKSQIGRKSRRDGAKFELAVRRDLESKGWVVSRWGNNVELEQNLGTADGVNFKTSAGLVPAKSNRFNLRTCGFPDYLVMRPLKKRDLFNILKNEIQ